ncbi:hypothetical protein [Phytoactinopolyspora limicola]|uniref:hypothetical protein n=1 Tax=Phytoactinopolyspora limicola TaxID=2715536 RepID=UPI0014083607|nr:hypothetical protein [Phytoactinopolyspora limicola]
MPDQTCASCRRTMTPRHRHQANTGIMPHYARGLCGTCYHREKRAGRLDQWPTRSVLFEVYVADLEWLVQTGESPEQWPTRLGTTAAALAKALYRHGRPDLARKVDRIAKRERGARR